MLGRAPAWWMTNAESVRREAEPYRDMPDDERLAHLAAACRAGSKLLALHEDRERALAHRDPWPADTIAAWTRLREAYARGRSG